MAMKQRAIGRRAIRHAIPWSREHDEDVAVNNERQNTGWIAYEMDYGNRHIDLPALGKGMLYVIEGDAVVPSSEAYFKETMDKALVEHGWYYREVTDKKAEDGKRWKKTKCGTNQAGFTLAPWYSQRIYEMGKGGNVKPVFELFEKVVQGVKTEFEAKTKRRVLAIEVHTDTQNVHFHLFYTRVDPVSHRYIAGTEKGIGTIGDWACGVLRQVKYRAIPANSNNARIADQYRQIVRTRSGQEPTDYAVNCVIDSLCERYLGSPTNNQRMAWWLQSYIQRLNQSVIFRLMVAALGIQKEIRAVQVAMRLTDSVIQGYWQTAKSAGETGIDIS
jgi:hypothetical protein